jgi:hypothetical protein
VATLGIVEFFLYLISEYYPDYDSSRKAAFADVHFMLFYTAIINAFQTVLTAFVTSTISKQMWIKTEMVELNHYVEIREEFDSLQRKLHQLETQSTANTKKSETIKDVSPQNDVEVASNPVNTSSTDPTQQPNQNPQPTTNESSPSQTSLSWYWPWKRCRLCYDRIRYRRIRRKYHRLMVQIRFHELRVHFLEAYQLPMKLKISDYLMRSEKAVLIKLVHVSPVAWLLLTGAVCLLHFVLGMVFHQYNDEIMIGTALTCIFFVSIGAFVLISWLVYHKMESIFHEIMLQKTLWDVHNPGREEREHLAKQQLGLFWGGDPVLVIAAIQFMQFGYSLSFSTLIVYWNYINAGTVGMETFLLAILLCYTMFVLLTGHVIPRYTLCTTLGQLVDEQRLRETVALYKLQEAQRQQRELLDLQDDPRYDVKQKVVDRSLDTTIHFDELIQPKEIDVSEPHCPDMHDQNPGSTITKITQIDEFIAKSVEEEMVEIHVQKEERSTVSNIAAPIESNAMRARRERLEQRKIERRKAHSEGVGFMSSMQEYAKEGNEITCSSLRPQQGNDDSGIFPILPPVVPLNEAGVALQINAHRDRRRYRRKSISDGVAFMAAVHEHDNSFAPRHGPLATIQDSPMGKLRKKPKEVTAGDLIAEMVKLDTDSLRATLPIEEQKMLHRREEERLARKFRRKTVSDGVKAMAALGSNMSSAAEKALGRPIKVTHDNSDLGKERFDWFPPGGKTENPVIDSSSFPRVRSRKGKSSSDGVAEMSRTNLLVDSRSSLWTSSMQSVGSLPLKVPGNQLVSSTADANSLLFKGAPKSLPLSTTPLVEKHEEEMSVYSAGTDDGYSDVDDVPATSPSLSLKQTKNKELPSLRARMRALCLGRRFRSLNYVFGTLLAFFLVGQRVESFNMKAAPEFVYIVIAPVAAFWMLSVLLLIFQVVSIVALYLVWDVGCSAKTQEREAILAGLLDIAISGVCLAVLFVAEAQRCCNSNRRMASGASGRFLAETQTYEDANEFSQCSCPAFGSRVYGGLGTLEPYASLICLRFFLRSSARFIVQHSYPTIRNEDSIKNSTMVDLVVKGKSHSRKFDKDIRIIVAQAWESTIGKNPDLVALHGEFSGEILRAMLGVTLFETDSPKENTSLPFHAGTTASQNPPLLEQSNFSTTEPEGRCKISSGKPSSPVLMQSNRQTFVKTLPCSDHIIEDMTPGINSRVVADNNTAFIAPNARLVRSMRRGDRKLLPMLDKWTVVDVVLTRFELVYFDATRIDEEILHGHSQANYKEITSTKGGKGLHLYDVSVGRRVVGHLSLEDIVCIHVERISPCDGSMQIEESPDVFVEKNEFWLQGGKGSQAGQSDRNNAWSTLKQDRLKIQTKSGHSLYFRFYSDLADALLHPQRSEDDTLGPLFKNNAFQWAQTIGRIVGSDQLHQPLPHFGDDTTEELRDYLTVLRSRNDSKGLHRSRSNLLLHRSRSSVNNGELLTADERT